MSELEVGGMSPTSREIFEREADTLRVMANPKRLMIVDILGRERSTVTEIANDLHLTLPNVSQHLRLMRDRGVVRAERSGRSVRYRLANPSLSTCCANLRRVLVQQRGRKR